MAARRFDPAGPLRGTLRPPPDKSISHRAALIGAMGEGETLIRGYLDAADTRSTLGAIASLGAELRGVDRGPLPAEIAIRGIGLRGARPGRIHVGNAGTLLRILPGWLAGQPMGSWTLDGDASIRRRPVDRVAEPLRLMGADVECREGRLPPLAVRGALLRGINYELPLASAQVKSCVLLAGLLAEGSTRLIEPLPSRDHTERMLGAAGAELEIGERDGRRAITVSGTESLRGELIEVPGDLSSAAFPLLAALLVPGSELVLEGVGLNPTRSGILDVLSRMGAAIEVEERGALGAEPFGTILARSSRLRGTRVAGAEVPLTIDELPLVALAGCFAEGETVIADAAELRHKESDRIGELCRGLSSLGAIAEPAADGLVVRGGGRLRGGTLAARGDHRLAMLGAVAGLASREGVLVEGFESAAVSYPGFERDLESLR